MNSNAICPLQSRENLPADRSTGVSPVNGKDKACTTRAGSRQVGIDAPCYTDGGDLSRPVPMLGIGMFLNRAAPCGAQNSVLRQPAILDLD